MWNLVLATALAVPPAGDDELEYEDALIITDEGSGPGSPAERLSVCPMCRDVMEKLEDGGAGRIGLELSWTISFHRRRDVRRFKRAMSRVGYRVATLLPMVPPRRRARGGRQRVHLVSVRTHVPCESSLVREAVEDLEEAARRNGGTVSA